MSGLGLRLAFASGWGRAVLLAACTAVVSGLLLVVVAVLSLPPNPAERLYAVVAETGTRGGYAFATALLTLPPLLLLHQAVRLGTSARERRLAALRLAGATPGEVRRIGAVEVGVPALAGAIAGIGVYWLLRLTLGGGLTYRESVPPGGSWSTSLRLVPTSVTPSWWQVLLVVGGVTLAGVATGLLASRRVIVTPLGVTRRTTATPPRPWGALLVLAGLALALGYEAYYASMPSGFEAVAPLLFIGLLVLGLVSLAPWTAYVVGRAVAARARTAPVMLAARRLTADPRPAGRAAAAVGGIGLIAGGGASVLADLMSGGDGVDAFYWIGMALAGASLLVALLAVVGSLSVHSVESLLDRKRAIAALTALGAPTELLVRAQRWEAGLVAVPMALGSTLLGGLMLGGVVGGRSGLWLVTLTLTLAALLGLVVIAIWCAVRLTRPWTLRAAQVDNLRTQ